MSKSTAAATNPRPAPLDAPTLARIRSLLVHLSRTITYGSLEINQTVPDYNTHALALAQ